MKHRLDTLVVILPGIMGSELRDADGKVVWGTGLGTLVKGVLTRASAIKRLELPAGIGDDPAPDGVVASAVLPDIHVIPGIWSVSIGYDRLTEWFGETFEVIDTPGDPRGPVNFVNFPYDWRLSNRASAQALQAGVEPLLEEFRAAPGNSDDAGITFVCHSMGGLVASYYVDVLGGHEVTDKVITMGTPYRGALNAVTALVNGVSKGWGPLKFDLTSLARSLPGLHQLLPEYACIESPSGLLKTTETALPDLSTGMVTDAMLFHEQIRDGAAAHTGLHRHPIIARTQPTATTARIEDGEATSIRTIEGVDEGGDGTVPRLSAGPYGVTPDDPMIRYVQESHGGLPANDAGLVELEGVLTASSQIRRDLDVPVGVIADDVVLAGAPLIVDVEAEPEVALRATLHDESGAEIDRATPTPADGVRRASFDDVAPGRYQLRVDARGTGVVVTKPLVVAQVEDD